jgi:hypothetical protein
MSRLPFRRPVLLLLALLLAAPAAAADREHPPAHYVPADMPIVITVNDGDEHVAAFRALLARLAFTESDTWRAMMANQGMQKTRIDLMGLAAAAETDVWTALGALLGKELVLGFGPGEGDAPAFILAAATRDDAIVDRLIATIHGVAGLEVAGAPVDDRTFEVRGTRVYRFDDGLLQCRVGSVLLLASSETIMERALSAERGERLASAAWYRDTRATVPAGAAVWASARREPLVAALGHPDPPAAMDNALAGFLFGGWWHALRHAEDVVAWAEPAPSALRLSVRATPMADAPPPLPGFRSERPVTVNALDAGEAAVALRVHRGWAELFGDREALLTDSAVSDLTNFTGTLTTLLGGVDFVDEVMENVAGPVQLVLARQDFSGAEFEPTPKLPAFALVIPLHVGESGMLRRRLDSAALTAASIINADDGRAGPGYLIDIETYREQRLMTMSLAPATEHDGGGMMTGRTKGVRYNFAPAASLVQDRYVIATSTPLMHEIIDAVLDGRTAPTRPGAAYDVLRVDARDVVAMLRDNREELVTDRMLEEDQARAGAERDIDAILGALEFVGEVTVQATTETNATRADIVLAVGAPATTATGGAEAE